MTKLSMIPISLALVAGVAQAQAPKAEKTAPAAADKKAPPADSKPNPDAGKAPPVAAKPPEMPKPPQQIADAIKAMSGTWKCTGTAEMGGQMGDVKATITMKSDLNGFWMQSNFTGTMGKLPPFKFTGFTTYDATSNKFFRMNANATGGHNTEWGTMVDKKITWEGDSRVRGEDHKVRDTEEMTGPKEMKVTGEYSKDGGKTWNKDHEATCKK